MPVKQKLSTYIIFTFHLKAVIVACQEFWNYWCAQMPCVQDDLILVNFYFLTVSIFLNAHEVWLNACFIPSWEVTTLHSPQLE